jgi:hypothetical protein
MNIVLNGLLVVIGAVCVLGIFHRAFNDTLLERVGMSAVALWAILRVSALGAHSSCDRYEGALLLYSGMATYAVGCARAKMQAWRRRHPPSPPPSGAPPTGPGELDRSIIHRQGLL